MKLVRRLMILTVLGSMAFPAWANSEKVVEIPSRGQEIRALELLPAEKPVASVILLPGGDGDLGLTADGKIKTPLANEVLVRSRQAYADAGFATLVPDMARDVISKRGSPQHAQDIGAMVKYMRGIAEPVVVIGHSTGSFSAANAVAHLTGAERPNAMVLTSAFLLGTPSVQNLAKKDPKRLAVPTLLVAHQDDKCPRTPPEEVEPFREWLAAAGQKVDVAMLSGGPSARILPHGATEEQQCRSPYMPHNFNGLDKELVERISTWIKALGK